MNISTVKLIDSFNLGTRLVETPQKKKFLFILCPPFNGSTVLYKIINSSTNVSTFLGKTFNNNGINLIPKGEGHTLLIKKHPEYEINRHNPKYKLPMEYLKQRFDEHWDLTKPILCDKSPAFIHHAHELEQYFSKFGDVYFITMIRSPYSCRWLKGTPWNIFAEKQLENIKTLKNVLYFRYEDLVSSPEYIKKEIINFLPELVEINMKVSKIHGLHVLEKRNQELSTEYRDRITNQKEKNQYLKNIPEQLDFFGYPLVHME
jgi:hypothetical protein